MKIVLMVKTILCAKTDEDQVLGVGKGPEARCAKEGLGAWGASDMVLKPWLPTKVPKPGAPEKGLERRVPTKVLKARALENGFGPLGCL